MKNKIGIIGGSGLGKLNLFKNYKEITINSEYGSASSPLICGTIDDVEVVILARHGREHTIPPSQVNYRANIMALKEAGCTHIIATTACGSLREEIMMGDYVILDQFIDFAKNRKNTFFEKFEPGEAKHEPMADSFDEYLRGILIKAAAALNVKFHKTGTVITIEGPRFSSRAESKMFRMWGGDVINMTVATETILAKEAHIPYAAIALSTDYDCWKEDVESVSWEAVFENFNKSLPVMTDILLKAIKLI